MEATPTPKESQMVTPKNQSTANAAEAFLAAKRAKDPSYGKINECETGLRPLSADYLWEMGLQKEAWRQARGE